ncbi:MAG: FecR domain-containing protein [Methylococcaceae bacterium]
MHQKIEYFILFGILIVSSGVQAEHHCSQWLAKIISSQGKVDIQYAGESIWKTVSSDQTFCDNDKIRTRKHSRVTILLRNESRATLKQSSTLIFLPPEQKTSSWYLRLLEGASFFRSREPQRLNIQTPFINAVHQGTEFLVTVDSEHAEIKVFDGQVAANNQQGEILIKQGFTGIAYKSQPPQVKALSIRPEDTVQWTLYYPPVINIEKGRVSKLNADDNQQPIGNLDKALSLLDKNQDLQNDSHYLTYIASLLLSVGSVDEALKFIDQVQTLEPDYSDALALRAIVSVVKNRQDEALNFAQKATTLNPQSATAQIALSYAYQSKLKIESALEATQKAVVLSPDNALAWARLSELQLSTGERSDALKSAQKAQQLNPRLDRTQTILGFAHLAEVDIDEANTAFTKSINLNSADPLARLGLGLAKIRKGNVEEGTRDLETAVSLDPDNAIMRSYLGKAYYELKNDGYAATELTIAKKIDPNDPTPWFYDAIRKQTTNRPVEALHDMQKAIELNDNRAVYRSKLLLDEDLAARSASLGRIYNDLGFQQLGLIEGWKSVNQDPQNFSAHRLLADNYASLPRHEIARVSELLQSQLLQPINSTPIQPQLVESRLGILEGLGSSTLSTNEYNPLFIGKKLNLQTNIIYGNNNTFGEDVVVSGLFDRASFNFGQFHYESDGYRANNDQDQNIYNAFIQYALTNKTNLQFEYRHQNSNNGDLSLKFDRSKFSNKLRETLKKNTFRLGASHRFTPESILIISALQSDFDEKKDGEQTNELTSNEGYLVETQYIFKKDNLKVILGTGFFRTKIKVTNTIKVTPCPVPSLAPSCIDARKPTYIDHDNGYIYTYFTPLNDINLSLGLSINSVDDEFGDRLQYNPKVGLIWNVSDFLTLRGAAFRVLKRNLLGDQTVEPTQISGFNQFFDDQNSTDTWLYGLASDFKITNNITSGVELTLRDLDVKFIESESAQSADWSESLIKSYVFWTPHRWWGLGIGYQFEKFNQTKDLNLGTLELETHRIPLSLNFFHPSGLSTKFSATYFNQSGNFIDNSSDSKPIFDDSSNFWVLDFIASYRLPKRYGKINFGILNVLNENFNFEERDKNNPRNSPDRSFYGSITLSF